MGGLITRRGLALALAGAAVALGTGCVSTRVTSSVVTPNAGRLERVVVVVRSGSFKQSNVAATLGQRNLDSLLPVLNRRLPVVLAEGGLPARQTGDESALPGMPLRVEAGEKVLQVVPVSASYSNQSGQALVVQAQLIDPLKPGKPLWKADIRMATLGFGKFDETVANDIGRQMLERLRADGMLPSGITLSRSVAM